MNINMIITNIRLMNYCSYGIQHANTFMSEISHLKMIHFPYLHYYKLHLAE